MDPWFSLFICEFVDVDIVEIVDDGLEGGLNVKDLTLDSLFFNGVDDRINVGVKQGVLNGLGDSSIRFDVCCVMNN